MGCRAMDKIKVELEFDISDYNILERLSREQGLTVAERLKMLAYELVAGDILRATQPELIKEKQTIMREIFGTPETLQIMKKIKERVIKEGREA